MSRYLTSPKGMLLTFHSVGPSILLRGYSR